MNLRATLALLLVALGLAAFVVFYEIGGAPERERAAAEAKHLWPGLQAAAIEEIVLLGAAPDEPGATRERIDAVRDAAGGWRLREPIDFPGDPDALDAMARTLADLSSEGRIDEPAGLEVYGLGEGARELQLRADGVLHGLRFGRGTPVGNDTYVAVLDAKGQPDGIFMVQDWRAHSLDRSLTALTDMRVAHFDRDAVDAIDLVFRDGSHVRLERGSGDQDAFDIVEPEALDADRPAVAGLLSTLGFLRADKLDFDRPPDAKTGLDHPALTIALHERGGQTVRVEIGGAADPGLRFVRGAAPALYEVQDHHIGELPSRLFDLRFKQLSSFALDQVRTVEWRFADPEGVLRFEKGAQGFESDAGPVARGALQAQIAALSRLAASRVVADDAGEAERAAFGLAPPRAAVRVLGEKDASGAQGELASVAFGVDRGGERLVARPDRHEVFAIDAAVAKVFPTSLEDARAWLIAPAPQAAPGAEAAPGPEAAPAQKAAPAPQAAPAPVAK